MIVWMSLRTGVPGQSSDYSIKNYVGDPRRSLYLQGHVDDADFSAVTIAVAVPLGFIFAWFVERTDSLQGSGDEPAEHRHSFSDLSQSDGLGFFAPSAHRRDQYIFHAAVRLTMRRSISRPSPASVLSGSHPGAAGIRDDSAALRSMNPALVEASSVHGVSSGARWCASSCRSSGRRCSRR